MANLVTLPNQDEEIEHAGMAYENKYLLLEDSQPDQLHYLSETNGDLSNNPAKSFDPKEEAYFNALHDNAAAQQLHIFC